MSRDDAFEDQVGVLIRGPLLGTGGHCVVHEAEQGFFGRKVALKSTRADVEHGDSARLLAEARITGLLDHPNIVPVYGVDGSDGIPKIILKRVVGEPWSVAMQRPPSADKLAWNVRVLTAVCNAVAYAHERNILHRDIKPQNVMVGPLGEIYLMDWGLAVSLDEADADRFPLASDETVGRGTPSFIAPEAALGEGGRLSRATDVFMLGATLYYLLARKPYRADDMAIAVDEAKVGRVPSFAEPVHPVLGKLALGMLAHDPADRTPLSDVRAALESFLANRDLDRMASRGEQERRAMEAAFAREDQEEVRRAYGTSVALFDAVLATDASRADARSGKQSLVVRRIEYALDDGDVQTARALAVALPNLPVSLRERLQADTHVAAAERAELMERRRWTSQELGASTRVLALGTVAFGWSAITFLLTYLIEPGHLRTVATLSASILFTAPGLAYAWWALPPTETNRRMLSTMTLLPLLGLSMVVVNVALGVDWHWHAQMGAVIFASTCGMLGALHDRLYLVSAGVWVGLYAGIIAWPDANSLLVGAGVLVVVLNGLIVRWTAR